MLLFAFITLYFAILISCNFGTLDAKTNYEKDVEWQNACELPQFEKSPRETEKSTPLNKIKMKGFKADEMVGSPVYISLATISSRINDVHRTIISILEGRVIPTHVYLFISREKYLIDNGVKFQNLPSTLLALCHSYPVSIIYTKNIGPHRKMLPLLRREKEKNSDVVIVSGDDDRIYPSEFLQNLVAYYIASGKKAVVAYRARRIALCQEYPHNPVPYGPRWDFVKPDTELMLALPTGTGGVLYRSTFFDDVIFDEKFRVATASTDDITFRLATMLNNVPVVVSCIPGFSQDRGTVAYNVKCTHGYLKRHNFTADGYPKSLNIFQRMVAKSKFKQLKEDLTVRDVSEGVNLYDSVNKMGGNEERWSSGISHLSNVTSSSKDITKIFERYLAIEKQPKCISVNADFYGRRSFVRSVKGLGLSFCCNVNASDGQESNAIVTNLSN